MPTTTTAVQTLKDALNRGNLADIADAIKKIGLGSMVSPLKRTFTGLTSASFFDLTTIDGTGETVGAANANRVAALVVGTMRVTAGAAATAARFMTDGGGTASATVAKISDDGKTVTFEAGVTAFIIEYIPRSATDTTSRFAAIA